MHRLVDASGDARTLVVAAQGRRSRATGQVVEVSGYVVDVTESHRSAAQREATAAIQAADTSRSVIERARGVLMVAYGVGPEEAFEILRVSCTSRSHSSGIDTFAATAVASPPSA